MYKGSSYGTIRSLYTISKPNTVQQKFCQKMNQHIVETNNTTSCTNCIRQDIGVSVSDPKFWGPGLWRAIHSGSLNYPKKATQLTIDKMKGFIYGLPSIMACKSCSTHALAFIQEHDKDLNQICESKDNLFKFFVDFHNYVNKRLGKPILSYSDVLSLYNSTL
jgi:hypothetical protein